MLSHAQPGAGAILEGTMPRHRPVTQRPGRYGLARRPACEHAHAQFSGFVYKNKGPLKSSIGGFGLLLPAILVSSSLGLKLTLQLIEQIPIRLFCATKQFS